MDTFAFDVYPDAATPHFAFSLQPAPAGPTCTGHAECMSTDVSLDVAQPVSAVHAPTQHLNQSIRPLQTPIASSDHQPEAVPRPPHPVDSEKAKGEMVMFVPERMQLTEFVTADDKHDDSRSSDSDSSDSDYMESSSSEDDSDSDSDSGSSEDDEEEASAAIAGPSKVDKGKGKAP
jgi:hypothetical protein